MPNSSASRWITVPAANQGGNGNSCTSFNSPMAGQCSVFVTLQRAPGVAQSAYTYTSNSVNTCNSVANAGHGPRPCPAFEFQTGSVV